MFYFGVVALGFAFIENMEYFSKYIKSPNVDIMELFALRTTMSMVMHMLMGLMMGYFIALSRLKNGWISIKYHLAGLGVATLMHGSYDFIVFALPEAESATVITLLLIPMTISFVMVTIAGKSLLKNSQRYQAILRARRKLLHTR
jgi:RsiW-degrading membrane proteinase PrsW (M82 family)